MTDEEWLLYSLLEEDSNNAKWIGNDIRDAILEILEEIRSVPAGRCQDQFLQEDVKSGLAARQKTVLF